MTRSFRVAFAVFISFLPAASTFAIESDDGTSAESLRATADLDRIRAARDRYEARRLVEQAARAEGAGRDAQAEPLYAKAVELDSTNDQAVAGLRSTRERLGLLTDVSPLMQRAEKERKAKRQEARYRFDAALRLARRGIKSGDPEGFTKARLQIDRARVIRAASPTLFSDEEAADLDANLRDHDLTLKRAIQVREDALRAAQQREWDRRIKDARVHDIRLD